MSDANGATGRVAVERRGAVLGLTIERPERANALTPELAGALSAELAAVAADGTVRVVVLRGAGGRAFCAGFDLGRLDDPSRTGLDQLMDGLDAAPVPTVAVLDGPAIGAGFELACRCDLRIARSDVEVGLPAVRLGVAYRAEGMAAILGATRGATGLLLTGEPQPVEALPGFAHVCVPAEQLEAEVRRVTQRLAANSPAAMAYTVRAARALTRATLPDALAATLAAERDAVHAGGDLTEAVRARREGREPVFGDLEPGGA